jgi:hypothetical protein
MGERLSNKHNPKEKPHRNGGPKDAVRALLLLAILSGGPALTSCSDKPASQDDGYLNRSVLHSVINPLNGDKYTTFNFANRETQAESEIDFHHLKSNPKKFERLLANLDGTEKSILDMVQENVPLGKDLEFQHSSITFLNTATGKEDLLQINRVKPTSKDAPEVTAYALFTGKDNPTNIGTILLSDRQNNDGERGEIFVALKPGIFNFKDTTERFANAYMGKASSLLKELQQKNFQDSRVDQAVWETTDKRGFFDGDEYTISKGILKGIPYEIRSQFGGDKMPGYNLFGKDFKSSEIIDGNGNVVAKITTNHYKGFDGPNGYGNLDSVIYTFSTVKDNKEKVVLEIKRYFEDKSETQTSTGVGTTVTMAPNGGLAVGWVSVDLQTPVNYQDVNTFLYSFGRREDNLSEREIEENKIALSAIFELLGGVSIVNGLNFQDSELEWGQSATRLIDDAQNKKFTLDMGFWSELPVDATQEGQEEALNLLTSK